MAHAAMAEPMVADAATVQSGLYERPAPIHRFCKIEPELAFSVNHHNAFCDYLCEREDAFKREITEIEARLISDRRMLEQAHDTGRLHRRIAESEARLQVLRDSIASNSTTLRTANQFAIDIGR